MKKKKKQTQRRGTSGRSEMREEEPENDATSRLNSHDEQGEKTMTGGGDAKKRENGVLL